jgi:hypothetical protein
MRASRGIKWKALIVSWVVDIGGSNVFGLIFLGWAVATGRISQAALSDTPALTVALASQPDLYATSMAGGLFFSMIAGYVGARIAGGRFLLYGLLSSAACLATDALSLDLLAKLPLWFAVIGVALAPAAGVFGGYVRRLELRRKESATTAGA